MIRLGKDKIDERFNILPDGTIVDLNGNIQKIGGKIRPYFKKVKIHQIQMWTNYGWRDTKIWVVHHLDENKQNNSLSNLIFMTRSEHMKLHQIGKKHPHSDESKRKISESHKGKHLSQEHKKKLSLSLIGHIGYMKGKKLGSSSKSAISNFMKGKIWINNGEIAKRHSKFDPLPEGFQYGMLKKYK